MVLVNSSLQDCSLGVAAHEHGEHYTGTLVKAGQILTCFLNFLLFSRSQEMRQDFLISLLTLFGKCSLRVVLPHSRLVSGVFRLRIKPSEAWVRWTDRSLIQRLLGHLGTENHKVLYMRWIRKMNSTYDGELGASIQLQMALFPTVMNSFTLQEPLDVHLSTHVEDAEPWHIHVSVIRSEKFTGITQELTGWTTVSLDLVFNMMDRHHEICWSTTGSGTPLSNRLSIALAPGPIFIGLLLTAIVELGNLTGVR